MGGAAIAAKMLAANPELAGDGMKWGGIIISVCCVLCCVMSSIFGYKTCKNEDSVIRKMGKFDNFWGILAIVIPLFWPLKLFSMVGCELFS